MSTRANLAGCCRLYAHTECILCSQIQIIPCTFSTILTDGKTRHLERMTRKIYYRRARLLHNPFLRKRKIIIVWAKLWLLLLLVLLAVVLAV